MTIQPSSPAPPVRLQAESLADATRVDALIDGAFGPGRLAKASERVREFAAFAPELSVCAWDGDRLLGVVRMWRVAVGDVPVVFLGPLAVEADERSAGVGGMLVERACEAAAAAGECWVLLVGDAPYFGRMGFRAEAAEAVSLPGPVNPRRVLARDLTGSASPMAGLVVPRRPA